MSNSLLGIKTNFKSVLKFTVPNMVLMLFLSLYVMIDGAFVSRFVGANALSGVNIVYPIITITMAVGIMFATGGSAICATKLGQQKEKEAKSDFTAISIVATLCGVLITVITLVFLEDLIYVLGANDLIFTYCYDYLYYTSFFLPFFITQVVAQFFLVTSGKPSKAFILTLIGGITNIVLDYVFIVSLNMGVAGAAIATGLGGVFSTAYGIYCFVVPKESLIKFARPKFSMKTILKSCSNGSSEMVSNIATAVTTYLFNVAMMRLIGPDGVAAITIILYSQFLLSALYMGYSSGVAPLFSYNYGLQDKQKIQQLFSVSRKFILILALIVFTFSVLFANVIVGIFTESGTAVNEIAVLGQRLFSISFIFSGTNIFASALFTAFSNGKVSALISFFRTFVFITGVLLILPNIIGVVGVWLAVPIGEGLCFIISLAYMRKYKSVYNY